DAAGVGDGARTAAPRLDDVVVAVKRSLIGDLGGLVDIAVIVVAYVGVEALSQRVRGVDGGVLAVDEGVVGVVGVAVAVAAHIGAGVDEDEVAARAAASGHAGIIVDEDHDR